VQTSIKRFKPEFLFCTAIRTNKPHRYSSSVSMDHSRNEYEIESERDERRKRVLGYHNKGPKSGESKHGNSAAQKSAHAKAVLGFGLAFDFLRANHKFRVVRLDLS